MKAKYVPVVKELCLEHLQTFDKSRYIEQIAAEMSEILPDLDVQKVESAALCVSNAMNSEARSVCGRRKTDAVTSKENCSHCVQVRSDPDTVCDSENVMPSSQNSSNWSTLLMDETLNSTFSPSQLDSTYTNDGDDSITIAKTTARACAETAGTDKNIASVNKKTTGASRRRPSTNKTKEADTKSDKYCVDDCNLKTGGSMTQCNLCMKWFHDKCVGIKKSDSVGWWCCGGCRLMTANVSMLLQHFSTFADSVSKQISQLSTNMNNRLQQLDDRITAHANQNKCILAEITSSQSDIQSSLANIKTDLDKKTNNLITKTQSIVDRIKAAPDSAPKKSQGKPGSLGVQNKQVIPSNKKSSNEAENRSKLSKNAKGDKPPPHTNKSVNPPNSTMSGNRVATASSGNSQPTASRYLPKPKRRRSPNLTLLVGSDTLKGITTDRLGNQVRVKTFNGVQTHQLREKLKAMNLEPYEKIILHIGECDVSAGADVKTLRSNMHKLLLDLRAKFTVVVSGLLPRKGHDIKAFNSKIKQLCQEYDVEFVDHHDSFVMASGEVPRSLFYGDKISLRPAGTATLVCNLDSKCKILRKHDTDGKSSNKPGECPSNPLYV